MAHGAERMALGTERQRAAGRRQGGKRHGAERMAHGAKGRKTRDARPETPPGRGQSAERMALRTASSRQAAARANPLRTQRLCGEIAFGFTHRGGTKDAESDGRGHGEAGSGQPAASKEILNPRPETRNSARQGAERMAQRA
jgi:hypothetical protein